MKKNFMSIATFACVLFTCASIISCSDDESFSGSKLIGTWRQYIQEEYNLDWELLREDNYTEELTFREDGIYLSSDSKPSSWKLNGNKLTIVRNDEVEVYRIKSLTAEELVLKYVWDDQAYNDYYTGHHYICKYFRVSNE
jgi:hypothetical protein